MSRHVCPQYVFAYFWGLIAYIDPSSLVTRKNDHIFVAVVFQSNCSWSRWSPARSWRALLYVVFPVNLVVAFHGIPFFFDHNLTTEIAHRKLFNPGMFKPLRNSAMKLFNPGNFWPNWGLSTATAAADCAVPRCLNRCKSWRWVVDPPARNGELGHYQPPKKRGNIPADWLVGHLGDVNRQG